MAKKCLALNKKTFASLHKITQAFDCPDLKEEGRKYQKNYQ